MNAAPLHAPLHAPCTLSLLHPPYTPLHAHRACSMQGVSGQERRDMAGGTEAVTPRAGITTKGRGCMTRPHALRTPLCCVHRVVLISIHGAGSLPMARLGS